MPLEFDEQKLPRLKPPHKDVIITRYLDLPKFLSLISTSTLFLARLDLMEDKYEGRMMKKSYENIKNWYLEELRTKKYTLEEREQFAIDKANEIKDLVDASRKTNVISSWNKYSAESYALWKIYARTDTGIMIKSKVSNLEKAFEKESKNLWISEIQYYKEDEGVEYSGNLAQYIIYKSIAYKYEEEIRIIYDINIGERANSYTFKWETRENPNGIYISIDPNVLIDEVMLGPDCQPWFQDIIISVCEKYGINKPVRISNLKYKES